MMFEWSFYENVEGEECQKSVQNNNKNREFLCGQKKCLQHSHPIILTQTMMVLLTLNTQFCCLNRFHQKGLRTFLFCIFCMSFLSGACTGSAPTEEACRTVLDPRANAARTQSGSDQPRPGHLSESVRYNMFQMEHEARSNMRTNTSGRKPCTYGMS